MGGSGYSPSARDFLSQSHKEDDCEKNFTVPVENVKNCEFYLENHFLPDVNSNVFIEIRNRLCVTINNQVLGYLPKSSNHLIKCINSGFSYTGIIIVSQEKPIINVMVNITYQI